VQLGLKGRSSVEVISGVNEHQSVILNRSASKQSLTDGSRVAAVSTQNENGLKRNSRRQ
jgi:hypothetical protein